MNKYIFSIWTHIIGNAQQELDTYVSSHEGTNFCQEVHFLNKESTWNLFLLTDRGLCYSCKVAFVICSCRTRSFVIQKLLPKKCESFHFLNWKYILKSQKKSYFSSQKSEKFLSIFQTSYNKFQKRYCKLGLQFIEAISTTRFWRASMHFLFRKILRINAFLRHYRSTFSYRIIISNWPLYFFRRYKNILYVKNMKKKSFLTFPAGF